MGLLSANWSQDVYVIFCIVWNTCDNYVLGKLVNLLTDLEVTILDIAAGYHFELLYVTSSLLIIWLGFPKMNHCHAYRRSLLSFEWL